MEGEDEEQYTSIFAQLNTYDDGCVVINWLPDSDDYYRGGFLFTAEQLACKILSLYGEGEPLVYPMLYCFRHFLELSFKRIIALGAEVSYCEEPRKNHDLRTLWSIARDVIESAPFVDLEWERIYIEHLVEEFSRIDETSTALRYATNRDGRPSLGESVMKVNVPVISEHMSYVGSSLNQYVRMMRNLVLRARREESS
jgi:hypothetical protein